MNTLLNLLLLTIIVCFVIDVSGIINSIKRLYLKKTFKLTNPDISVLTWKPFDCSLCMTWWTGIIYLLCIGDFTLVNFSFVTMLAALSSEISEFIRLIKDIISKIESLIQKLLQK